MGKQLLYDPLTGEKKLVDVPDVPIVEAVSEPTTEDRLKAVEDAILKLMG